MSMNVGGVDRVVRFLIGAVALALAFTRFDVLNLSALGIILAVVGVVAIVTSLVGFCPAYVIFGLRTCPLKNAPSGSGGENTG